VAELSLRRLAGDISSSAVQCWRGICHAGVCQQYLTGPSGQNRAERRLKCREVRRRDSVITGIKMSWKTLSSSIRHLVDALGHFRKIRLGEMSTLALTDRSLLVLSKSGRGFEN